MEIFLNGCVYSCRTGTADLHHDKRPLILSSFISSPGGCRREKNLITWHYGRFPTLSKNQVRAEQTAALGNSCDFLYHYINGNLGPRDTGTAVSYHRVCHAGRRMGGSEVHKKRLDQHHMGGGHVCLLHLVPGRNRSVDLKQKGPVCLDCCSGITHLHGSHLP